MQVFYGLERLPRSLALDDSRLPSLVLGSEPLRLNTLPIPASAWSDDRWAALETWLFSQCGDYNKGLRRSVSRYLAEVVAQLDAHEAQLTAGLGKFGGLYRVEDWRWSAMRPLPRAWWQEGDSWRRADLAFWDGSNVLTEMPVGDFWVGETLPRSPFRRAAQTVISIT
jgi:hypothetical protein